MEKDYDHQFERRMNKFEGVLISDYSDKKAVRRRPLSKIEGITNPSAASPARRGSAAEQIDK